MQVGKVLDTPIKGRGAVSVPEGRFESLKKESFDETFRRFLKSAMDEPREHSEQRRLTGTIVR
jgi:hypothetical protein